MTLYGESEPQFRPRPGRAQLALFVVASTLLSAWLASLLSSLVMQAAAAVRLIARTGVPIALFPAGPQDLPGMSAVIDPARVAIAPLILLIVATVLLAFWPSSGTLAARLSVVIAARTFAIAALTQSLSESPIEWLSGDLSAVGLWRPAVAIACAILLWRSEMSLLNLLSMFFDLERATRRTIFWSIASIPQWVVWLLMGSMQGYKPAIMAALIAAAITMTAGAGLRHVASWERLTRPRMVEDTIIASVAALVVTLAGYATFGAPLVGLERHVVVLDSSPIAERIPLREVRVTTTGAEVITPGEGDTAEGVEGEPVSEDDEAVIDIRWSEGSGKQKTPPPASTTTAP